MCSSSRIIFDSRLISLYQYYFFQGIHRSSSQLKIERDAWTLIFKMAGEATGPVEALRSLIAADSMFLTPVDMEFPDWKVVPLTQSVPFSLN